MIRCIACFLALLVFVPRCVADEKKVPLKTDIPREVLAGTPPNVLKMLFPGLEMPPEEQPEFLVPEGTTNLALRRPVTASDPDPILGKLEQITDGHKEGTDDGFVELPPGLQWVQIDLGAPARIYAIYVWHFFREARGYHAVIVQVADDEQFTTNVQTVYNNDIEAVAKMGIGKDRPYIETHQGLLVDAKEATGRYVRLYSRGNTANNLNHYVEVEVFGKPIAKEN